MIIDIEMTENYTKTLKTNDKYELKANEGYWITTKEITINSSFVKRIRTSEVELYGTVTDDDKIYIEEEIKKLTTL